MIRLLPLLLLLLAGPAAAQGPGLDATTPRSSVDVRQPPWSSLVRVQIPELGRCTGVLLAPDRVGTAAHCLYSARLQRFVPPHTINVLLAYDRGGAAGHAVASSYRTGEGFDPRRYRATAGADAAVIMLATPLTGPALRLSVTLEAAQVAIGGYQQDRREVLLADVQCQAQPLGRDGGRRPMLVHNCAATLGSSGAPVLRRIDGTWFVMGVQTLAERNAARGMAVPAAVLRALLDGP